MKFTEEDLWQTIQTLGWQPMDDIHIEIGGTSVYAIDGAGTKWAPKKGTRKYNEDAFIVIRKHKPVISSKPNVEESECDRG